ncbi:MAG: hypothetical protein ACI8Z1_002908 [Candidatus Azotimanducaceae bacterium]
MSPSATKQLGIIVNPFSGRDVRRVAARASTSDHLDKQQQVTRLVLGALSQGVDTIYLGHEPFRINEKAVENLPERDQIEILRYKLTHKAQDTQTMAELMWEKGCRTFIVLGGDGTSRIVARRFSDATILPLSTGTNNVFPYRLEATIAGMAAGLIATDKVSHNECQRCKMIHITSESQKDIALIDAVLLHNDFLGSLLPFKAADLGKILLTRAEPASVGMSPIGGLMTPAGHHDDFGVLAVCNPNAATQINVPVSPGLHEMVGVESSVPVDFGQEITFTGPGILAFDGDREIKLAAGESATASIERNGPRIIEAERVMALAAQQGLFTQ